MIEIIDIILDEATHSRVKGPGCMLPLFMAFDIIDIVLDEATHPCVEGPGSCSPPSFMVQAYYYLALWLNGVSFFA